jgi:type II secretory pathway component GspD/PulD (secretin)
MRALNKFLFILFFSFPGIVFAVPVSLEFVNATALEIANVLLREVLKCDFVMSSEVISLDKKITVSIRGVEPDKLLVLFRGIMQTVDVQAEERDGVLYLERGRAVIGQSGSVNSFLPLGAGKESSSVAEVRQDGALLSSPFRGGRPADEEREIESYQPRGRSIEFLAEVVKLVGASVVSYRGEAGRLVYAGSREVLEKTRKILAEVDAPPSSVHVRAVLVEFTDGDSSVRSLSLALDAFAGKLGLALVAGQVVGNALTYRGTNLNTVISAIDGDSRFRYIAEPSIRVVDGESAKFMVGSEQPTRGSVTTDNSGNSQQSIDYKSAGVMISLKPRVLADHVQLEITQQFSSFALTTTSNIDSPTILKREAQTTVSVRPGELVVLAGMDEQRDSSSSSGLFFLPDFMRGSNSEKSRSQLVLMLEVKSEDAQEEMAPVDYRYMQAS